ncbi:MAG TPA: transglycosylase SLT domain-containing protein, partial [Sphingobacteriaceae bacterium]
YYFPIFEKALRSKGVPEEVKYLSIVESALDPQAVSRVGATGPWQFMFSSGKAFGLTIDDYQDERKDPIAASYAAANYFRDAYNEFGDWLLALAAYNCGKGNVNRAIRLAGGVNDFWAIREFLPKETRNYVPAFIATTYVMNYYENHGISRRKADLPLYTDTVAVNKHVTLKSVSRAAGLDLDDLVTLNPSYIRQIVNGTPESPKRLIIPQIGRGAFTSLYNALNLIKEDPAAQSANGPAAGETRKTFITYTVQPGDTLSGIVKKFGGADEGEIRQVNGISGETLRPGTVLRIGRG